MRVLSRAPTVPISPLILVYTSLSLPPSLSSHLLSLGSPRLMYGWTRGTNPVKWRDGPAPTVCVTCVGACHSRSIHVLSHTPLVDTYMAMLLSLHITHTRFVALSPLLSLLSSLSLLASHIGIRPISFDLRVSSYLSPLLLSFLSPVSLRASRTGLRPISLGLHAQPACRALLFSFHFLLRGYPR